MISPGIVQVAVVLASSVPDVPLPTAEVERAANTVHPLVRRDFVAGRRLVRMMLAPMLGCAPDGFDIALDPLGRPFVADGPSFSISHCDGWVGVALAASDVGLDLEPGAPSDADTIAQTVMTAGELSAFLSLPREQRPGAFARLWVRKEALLKAGGLGFSTDPRSVTAGVDACPVDPARLPGFDSAWHIADLTAVGQGAPTGAVALRDHRPVIRFAPTA